MKLFRKLLRAFSLLMPLFVFATGNVFGAASPDDYTDDYVPDVTARVARITYISGDVQIRRSESAEWEAAVTNLPIVEGDEIATSGNALLEIQLGKDAYLRLAQNSYIKFLNLKDEGIAVSLSEGVLSARLFEFDKDAQYFEIDAPGTTVAVRKAGLYRIDAEDSRSREKAVRVTVNEDGEARVYSTSSGFTLRGGRTAKVFLEGDYAGEWELADASGFYDEFDEWIAKSDAAILKRIRDAFYDKYYDRDIYGAEDLNAYGEWIYTRKYGYVWRPYRSAIDDYADWSPYRYGHWRWIPPFGWTWVNDEPWGWATYHHGRWVFVDGYWVWTPYGLVRAGRSWWRPALIFLGTWGGNVYWCPLPYDYGYYNYNRRYHRRNRRDGRNNNPPNNPPGSQNPPPSAANIKRGERNMTPPLQRIPPTGVVIVPESEFGRGKRGFLTPPLATAKQILTKIPETADTPPILPEMKDLNGKISTEILIEKPRVVRSEPTVKIGAGERKTNAPIDTELERKRIYGNRTPIRPKTETDERKTDPDDGSKGGMTGLPNRPPRKTGAVNRPVFKQDDDGNKQNEPAKTDFPNRSEEQKVERKTETPPVYTPPVRRDERRSQPRIEQPRRSEPKSEPPPPRREQPKYEPPPTRSEPKYEPPPRRDPPPPKNDPPKSDPPREERKPSPPLGNVKDKKDS